MQSSHYSLKYFAIFLLITVTIVTDVLAANRPYTTDDWIKIAALALIIITIISPYRIRVIIIGTVLGLAFTYYTYRYLVPFLRSLFGI